MKNENIGNIAGTLMTDFCKADDCCTHELVIAKLAVNGCNPLSLKFVPTIMLIIFRDFLMVGQIFLSSQVKRSVIITNKIIYTSFLKSCQTT